MTTPPDLPASAPADPAGLMHEQTFNEALAQALRQRRHLWRTDPNSVLAERLRTLADATRERPDILVAPPDIYPVIIEVEFDEPAFADARRKLGRLIAGTTDRVRAAIAVGVRRRKSEAGPPTSSGNGWHSPTALNCAWPSSTPARREPTPVPAYGLKPAM